MRLENDEWLRDYVNAIRLTVRRIETESEAPPDILGKLKNEADALIQEAILCNIPMEVFEIRNLVADIPDGETPGGAEGDPPVMGTHGRDTGALLSGYRFVREGLGEFTLDDIVEACSRHLSEIHPDAARMRAGIVELFNTDLELGLIREKAPGVFVSVPT